MTVPITEAMIPLHVDFSSIRNDTQFKFHISALCPTFSL